MRNWLAAHSHRRRARPPFGPSKGRFGCPVARGANHGYDEFSRQIKVPPRVVATGDGHAAVKHQLIDLGREFHARGWSLATSSNYSGGEAAITASDYCQW